MRTLATNASQLNPHFDAHPFSPSSAVGGPIFSRAGLIGRYNVALGQLADEGDLTRCLQLAARMKTQGVKPDVLTYHCLIRACGKEGLTNHAVAIFEDMLAAHLQPERETFHLLFKVSLLARIDLGVFADYRTGPYTRKFESAVVAVE